MLIFAIIALLIVGLGVALGLIALGILAVLTGLGIVSTSAFLGLWTRRPSMALRAFVYQTLFFACIPVGVVTAWLVASFSQTYLSALQIILSGAAVGAASGLVLAAILLFGLRLTAMLVSRIIQPRCPTPSFPAGKLS